MSAVSVMCVQEVRQDRNPTGYDLGHSNLSFMKSEMQTGWRKKWKKKMQLIKISLIFQTADWSHVFSV